MHDVKRISVVAFLMLSMLFMGCEMNANNVVGVDEEVSDEGVVPAQDDSTVSISMGPDPYAIGYTSCQPLSNNCNPTTPSIAVISNPMLNIDLGYYAAETEDFPPISIGRTVDEGNPHWQGIQRLSSGGGRYLAISRSETKSSRRNAFVVVDMGSHNNHGAMISSNRIFQHPDNIPLADKIVSRVPMPNNYEHAGGMQAIGQYLAVAFEDVERGETAMVAFYDMIDPRYPRLMYTFKVDGWKHLTAVALAKLRDGTYAMMTYYQKGVISKEYKMRFYKSTTTDLRNPYFRYINTPSVTNDWNAYQTLNLVTTRDGRLYLVGMYNDHVTTTMGDNFAEVFPVSFHGTYFDVESKIIRKQFPKMEWESAMKGGEQGSKEMGDVMCQFNAASGIYVDWEGQLIIYCTPHDGVEKTGYGWQGFLKSYYMRPIPTPTPASVMSVRTSIENGHPKLSWNPVAHAVRYVVLRGVYPLTSSATRLIIYDATSFVDLTRTIGGTNLVPEAGLWYGILAVGADGTEVGPYTWFNFDTQTSIQ